ncbi:MAG: flagellar hook-length control protein FliK [Paraglaciecola sp.]|nr:flagellar hook-length control protein FliK [Paraglaciecola sp.]NCT47551.1 flagellar hook-length control protein FliK [Paraglaciecola sp.]
MTDIPLTIRTQLSQALTQLSQVAPDSVAAREAIEVIVKQLGANQISLSSPAPSSPLSLFKRLPPVVVNSGALQGSVVSGQTYQLKLTNDGRAQLQFYLAPTANSSQPGLAGGSVNSLTTSTATSTPTSFVLSPEIAKRLLTLPATQLSQTLSAVQGKDNTRSAAQVVSPTNVSAPVTFKLSANVLELAGNNLRLSIDNPSLTAKLSTQSTPNNVVDLPLTKQSLAQVQSSQSYAVGEKVNLVIQARGNNWQVSIWPVSGNQSVATKGDVALQVSQRALLLAAGNSEQTSSPRSEQNTSNPLKTNTTTQTSSIQAPATALPSIQTSNSAAKALASDLRAAGSSDKNVNALIKVIVNPLVNKGFNLAILPTLAQQQPLELPLDVGKVVKQINQIAETDALNLAQQLSSGLTTKLVMQVPTNGEFKLLVYAAKLVAQLPLDTAMAQALKPLNINNLEKVITNLQSADKTASLGVVSTDAKSLNIDKTSTNSRDNQSLHASKNTPIDGLIKATANQADQRASNIAPINGNEAKPRTLVELKLALAQALNANSDASNTRITPALLNNKVEQLNLLHSLLRIVNAKADVPSNVLQQLDQGLLSATQSKELNDSNSKEWVKQLTQELKQSLPRGNEQDAAQIKQLLTQPAFTLSPVSIVTPPSTPGLLAGLLTLLQVSLASRLLRNQPSLAERVAQVLPSILSGNESTSSEGRSSAASKTMQEFSQLEQKQQLMRNIGKLLADHQSSKLNNAERMVQGQESFYYNLPAAFGGDFKNIELLIRRDEQREQDNSQHHNDGNKHWQLTMKLSVGEVGELLTKARLRPDEVDLDFYASNDEVKYQVLNFLPILKRRFSNLGITIAATQCQLGKIPTTLAQRPYHIFSTQA